MKHNTNKNDVIAIIHFFLISGELKILLQSSKILNMIF